MYTWQYHGPVAAVTWISHPPAASCPKWPGHKLSWKKQDWETSGNASFFKPSHTKKKISFWLFTINHCYHHYYYHYPYWFSQAKSTFLGNNDLTNQRLFFTNSPSGCLWLRWTDFGATRVLVFIGRQILVDGGQPFQGQLEKEDTSNCFLCWYDNSEIWNKYYFFVLLMQFFVRTNH